MLGVSLNVRVGVHRGLVYRDTAQDDVYGLAANLAARVCDLAPSNAVVVSEAVARLVRNDFDLEARPAAAVKGVEGLIGHHQVTGERVELAKLTRGPLVGRDRELARLQKCWARAQTGTLTTPGMVFRGEPGIGKSRLAAAAVDLVETSGGVVLELMGSPFHTDAGLHPVRARYWSAGVASAASPSSPNGCGCWTPRCGPAGCIQRVWCRCWRRSWGSAPSMAMSRCRLRAASSMS